LLLIWLKTRKKDAKKGSRDDLKERSVLEIINNFNQEPIRNKYLLQRIVKVLLG